MDTKISDLIKTCQNVETETDKVDLLTAALKSPDKLCYNCKTPDHLQKDFKIKKRKMATKTAQSEMSNLS